MTGQPSLGLNRSRWFRCCVGTAAIVAPALHSITDVMEWWSGGFTDTQLWLNVLAFLAMPVLLLGIYAVFDPRPPRISLAGAILYGVSFAYFLFTTLYAISRDIPDYATLWSRLGTPYTVAGGLMVLGGVLFAVGALSSSTLPVVPIWFFLIGIVVNLGLAMLPGPEILQTLGSGLRNVGLMLIGYAIVSERNSTD